MRPLLFLAALTGCGTDDSQEASAGSAPPHSLLVQDAAALPECTAETEGWLVYVKADGAFKACSSAVWEVVILKSSSPSAPPQTAPTAKLTKGMTKVEAQAAVGAPKEVSSSASGSTDWDFSGILCPVYCYVTFGDDGLLMGSSGIKAEYIDLATF